MISIILIAFVSLIGLLILHEGGHFIAAKRFGVEVEEFGVGYPPRLFGKKIGETIYSLNLLPLGAFVRIPEKKLRDKPIWQRAVILIAGIVSFWVICAILITIIFWIGSPFQISDEEEGNLINPRVQIVTVSSGSPAEEAGLEIGDVIEKLKVKSEKLKVNKVGQVQEFTKEHKGEEIVLTIKRGKEELDVNLVPRVSPPEGQGPMGVGLARVATKKYPLTGAVLQGVLTTLTLTWQIVLGLVNIIKRAVLRKPFEAKLVGVVGILDIFVKAGVLGPIYFLQTLALISLHLAVANALPIPVADGGRLLFLAIEKIRKKPLNEKIEQRINAFFFALLLFLMIWITIRDIGRLI